MERPSSHSRLLPPSTLSRGAPQPTIDATSAGNLAQGGSEDKSLQPVDIPEGVIDNLMNLWKKLYESKLSPDQKLIAVIYKPDQLEKFLKQEALKLKKGEEGASSAPKSTKKPKKGDDSVPLSLSEDRERLLKVIVPICELSQAEYDQEYERAKAQMVNNQPFHAKPDQGSSPVFSMNMVSILNQRSGNAITAELECTYREDRVIETTTTWGINLGLACSAEVGFPGMAKVTATVNLEGNIGRAHRGAYTKGEEKKIKISSEIAGGDNLSVIAEFNEIPFNCSKTVTYRIQGQIVVVLQHHKGNRFPGSLFPSHSDEKKSSTHVTHVTIGEVINDLQSSRETSSLSGEVRNFLQKLSVVEEQICFPARVNFSIKDCGNIKIVVNDKDQAGKWISTDFTPSERVQQVHMRPPENEAEFEAECENLIIEKLRAHYVKGLIDLASLSDIRFPINETWFHLNAPVRENSIRLSDLLNLDHKSQNQRVLLEGGAGAGKSVLCQSLATSWARKEAGTQYRLVLILSLATLGVLKEVSWGSLLRAEYLAILNYREDLLDKLRRMVATPGVRDIFFCLDGHDEIKNFEPSVSNCLNTLLERPNVLVTSRPYGQEHSPVLETFEKVYIEPFQEEDIQAYIAQFFQVVPTKFKPSRSPDELKALIKMPVLHEICCTPIHLEFVCTSWITRSDLSGVFRGFISTTELYTQLVIELCKRYLRKRQQRFDLSDSDVLSECKILLHLLDYFGFIETERVKDGSKPLDESHAYVRKQFREDISNQDIMTSYILVKIDRTGGDANSHFGFRHPVFGSFFVARYLASCFIDFLSLPGEEDLGSECKHKWMRSGNIRFFLRKSRHEDWFEKASPFMAGYFVRVGHFGALKSFLALLFSDENELVNLYSILVATKCLDEVWEPLVKEDLVFSNQLLELVCQWLYISLTTPDLFSPLNKFWFVLRSCRNLIEALSRNGIFKETGEGFSFYLGGKYGSVSPERLKDLNKVLDLQQSISYQEPKEPQDFKVGTLMTTLREKDWQRATPPEKNEVISTLVESSIRYPGQLYVECGETGFRALCSSNIARSVILKDYETVKDLVEEIFRIKTGMDLPRPDEEILVMDKSRPTTQPPSEAKGDLAFLGHIRRVIELSASGHNLEQICSQIKTEMSSMESAYSAVTLTTTGSPVSMVQDMLRVGLHSPPTTPSLSAVAPTAVALPISSSQRSSSNP